jgi:hypothetical protein
MNWLAQNIWIIVFWASLVVLFAACLWKYEKEGLEPEEELDLRGGLQDRRQGSYVGHIIQYDRRHSRDTRRKSDRKSRRGTDH